MEIKVKNVANEMLKPLINSLLICEKLEKNIENLTLNYFEKEGAKKIVRKLQYECEKLIGMSQKIINLVSTKLSKTT